MTTSIRNQTRTYAFAGLALLVCSTASAQTQFQQQGGKLTGLSPVGLPLQGYAVAISSDGNTAIIGGPAQNGIQDINSPGIGAAWVFTRSAGSWTQQAKLVGTGAIGNSAQGFSVGISADGNTAVVGGPADASGPGGVLASAAVGAAWVFGRSGTTWSQQAKLIGSGAPIVATQGIGVAISGDGNTIVAAGPTDGSATGGFGQIVPGAGAAWVFVRSGNLWAQQGNKLIGTGASAAGQGYSVAISGDGNTFIEGGAQTGVVGPAWVFTRSGSTWSQQGGPLSASVGATELLGASVALSSDGNTALVAAYLDSGSSQTLVYTRSGATWTQQTKLVTTGGNWKDVGLPVAISGDGNTAVIGAPSDSGNAGGVRVYTRSNGTWSQLGGLLAGSGGSATAYQGGAVAISADGNTFIEGGPEDANEAGAAWIFARPAPVVGPPTVTGLSPQVSSGASQTLTVIYNAPGGYQTLDVLNVLINTVLDGRVACYFAYSRPSNALYIVPNNGDGSQITGKVMDGTGTVSNSQCTATLAGSTASGSGNSFTLTLNLSFSASFSGNKVVYAAARDLSQGNSEWQTMGVHAVPPLPSTFPNAVGMNPSSGSTLNQTITFTYQDQSSTSNLQTVWALINTAIDGRAACYVAYYRPGNQLFLYPDNGDGSQATNIVLTGSNTISNSQCSVFAQGASVQNSGNTLTVSLPITFKPAFAGFKGVWMAAYTQSGAVSPWQALGAELVPAQ